MATTAVRGDALLTIRISKKLKDALDREAKADRRSLSNYVRVVLEGRKRARS